MRTCVWTCHYSGLITGRVSLKRVPRPSTGRHGGDSKYTTLQHRVLCCCGGARAYRHKYVPSNFCGGFAAVSSSLHFVSPSCHTEGRINTIIQRPFHFKKHQRSSVLTYDLRVRTQDAAESAPAPRTKLSLPNAPRFEVGSPCFSGGVSCCSIVEQVDVA